MKASALLTRLLSIAILLLAFGTAVHRAKVRTIAHDEALTYEWFLDQGVYHVLEFNFTNHVLQTLLAKPSVKILGVSEFNLRIPSLIGAGIYLIATYFLCGTLFGDGLFFLLSVTMLSLNPPILDLMAAARGYSLGLGFLVVAMYVFARLVEKGGFNRESKEWRWGCGVGSVALALSLASNFSNVVPVICLGFTFILVTFGGPALLWESREHLVHDVTRYLIVPGLALDFCILWPFLIQARMSQTRTPLDSASDSIRDVFTGSFLYKWTEDVFNLGAIPPVPGSWQQRVTDLGEYVLLPALFCFVLLGLVLALRSSAGLEKRQSALCTVFAGAAICCVLLFIVMHVTLKIDYPYCRYCLYLIPLFTVSGLLAAQVISSRLPSALSTFLKGAVVIIAAVIVMDYAMCLDSRALRYNAYDVISRDLYQAIEKDARAHDLENVRVGGTWWYEPEINFYRVSRHADWMLPYDVKDRSYWWHTPNSLTPADYDYFVFVPDSDPGLAGPRVRSIYHDPKTQLTILAIAR
jgi:4-amino-4-deoxy-L-arabinose transferase-like glycosyltransferase